MLAIIALTIRVYTNAPLLKELGLHFCSDRAADGSALLPLL